MAEEFGFDSEFQKAFADAEKLARGGKARIYNGVSFLTLFSDQGRACKLVDIKK